MSSEGVDVNAGRSSVIDCQFHWQPELFFELHLGRSSYPRAERTDDGYMYCLSADCVIPFPSRQCDLEAALADANEAGIDAVVSSVALGVDELPPAEAQEIAVALNEARAEAESAHPGRFYGLATLPMQDTEAALATLDDASQRLGLRGVCIYSNVAGAPLDAEHCRPVYARLAELDMPLFLHPTRTILEDRLPAYGLEYVVGYVFDTTIAALNLVFSEILDELPNLKVVHPHLGGVVPFLAGRIDFEYRQPWAMDRELRLPPTDYLKRFYVDTVSLNPAALRAGVDFYGLDRVLFGSDYPFWPARSGLELVRENLPPSEASAVLGGNASELLGL